MKAIINKTEFLNLLGVAGKCAASKGADEQLKSVLLNMGGGGLSVTATDMEITYRGAIAVESEETGACCLPAKKLADCVRMIPAPVLALDVDLESFKARLAAGKLSYDILALASDDFPAAGLDELEALPWIPISSDLLALAIDQTIKSTSDDTSRYVLSGIHITFTSMTRELRFESTDGHRCVRVDVPLLDDVPKLPKNCILPKRAAAVIRKAIDGAGEVLLAVRAADILVKSSAGLIVARRLEGQFPDIGQVLVDVDKQTQVEVPRVDLVAALRAVMVLVDSEWYRVELTFTNGGVKLLVAHDVIGEARSSVDLVYDGQDRYIALNSHYLLDALGSLNSETVTLGLTDHDHALMIRAANQPGYAAVIMPLQWQS